MIVLYAYSSVNAFYIQLTFKQSMLFAGYIEKLSLSLLREMTYKISDKNFTCNDLESKDQIFSKHSHSALTYIYAIQKPLLLSFSLANVEKNSIEFSVLAQLSTPDVLLNDYHTSDTWEVETAYLTDMDYEPEDDNLWIYKSDSTIENKLVFRVYKLVDKKVHSVTTTFPKKCQITLLDSRRSHAHTTTIMHHPPIFSSTHKILEEHIKILNINAKGFLWSKEKKLFQYIIVLNKDRIAFEDIECRTLKNSYFSLYIIPTIQHTL